MKAWQQRLHEIIYEADTPAGKAFDVFLIASILLSVAAVTFESVDQIRQQFGPYFRMMEWFFTVLFTVEYILRILAVQRPSKYIFSFFGIVDLLALLPNYLSIFFFGTQSLLVVRSFRLLRIFRVFKMGSYLRQAKILQNALVASRQKIVVFLVGVLATVFTVGALMHLIEGDQSGFTNIPVSVYWAIVTMTTVGYGDIAPQTPLGQAFASVLMILGYGVLAVPTGIMSVEIAKASISTSTQACPSCTKQGHEQDAIFCKYCGDPL